jgi:hypothetical protein
MRARAVLIPPWEHRWAGWLASLIEMLNIALHPSREELIAAARWSMTHDPSPGYRTVLKEALSALGVDDGALGA